MSYRKVVIGTTLSLFLTGFLINRYISGFAENFLGSSFLVIAMTDSLWNLSYPSISLGVSAVSAGLAGWFYSRKSAILQPYKVFFVFLSLCITTDALVVLIELMLFRAQNIGQESFEKVSLSIDVLNSMYRDGIWVTIIVCGLIVFFLSRTPKKIALV